MNLPDTRNSLAILIGYKPKTLSYVLYQIPEAQRYAVFTLPKRNGGFRKISSPNAKLKDIQKRILEKLSESEQNILRVSNPERSLSHAFKKHHSILTHATKHTKKRFVFNLDLENFFDSINFGRVRRFLMVDKNYLLSKETATTIAHIACHNGSLPQGSPLSPILTNMIGRILDQRLVKLAKEYGCTFSRYADDITFSSNLIDFPNEIAERIGPLWKVGKRLEEEISSAGFSINQKKVVMYHRHSRQVVTGLVVNNRSANTPQEYLRKVRQYCHALFTKGKFTLLKTETGGEEVEGTLNQLEGYLGYIFFTKMYPGCKQRTIERNVSAASVERTFSHNFLNNKQPAYVNLFKKFLLYRYFYANEKPTVIFEGKTDKTYSLAAIKALRVKFPKLYAEKAEDRSFQIVRLPSVFRHLFCISENSDAALKLKGAYEGLSGTFSAPIPRYPVVFVIDNDSGADEYNKRLKPNPTAITPLFGLATLIFSATGKDEDIETLFHASTLSTAVAGRTFSRHAVKDDPNYYGKEFFARNVVVDESLNHDFTGFESYLDRLQRALFPS